jgi:hypothetical protein
VGANVTTVSGWQVALPNGDPRHVAVTDVLKVGTDFFLRLAVGLEQKPSMGLLKVTSDGTVTLAEWFPDLLVNRTGKMFLTQDGFLLTAGYDLDHSKAFLIWINQSGTVDHSVTVQMVPYQLHPDAPYAHSFEYQDLALLPNGDIILIQNFQVCSREYPCPGSGALITRLSPSGKEIKHIWTVGLHALGIGGQTFINEIRQEGDQLILVGGSHLFLEPRSDFIHLNVLMASLNLADGKPTWLHSLGPKRYSGSMNEFKTDYAYAWLPTGDGRMIFTGTTDSFGSMQVYKGKAYYYQHFDLLVGMAGLKYGGIQGASSIMWSPDLSDEYKVWAAKKDITLGDLTILPVEVEGIHGLSLTPVEYTAEPLELTKRDLADGFPRDIMPGLELKVSDKGRYLVSNRSFLTDFSTDDGEDGDGLDQEFENAAMELVKPILELEKHESWLANKDKHHVVEFVRVTPYPTKENPIYIKFVV